MSLRVFCVFALFLLNWLGKCEEPSEHALGNNYEQIFNSMPTLFEYLLEMLKNQSGLLEKNEVSFFQDSKQPKEEVKREIKENNIQIDEFDGNFKGFTDDTAMDIPEKVTRSNLKIASGEFPKALRIGEVTDAVDRKPNVNNDFKNKYVTKANNLNHDTEMISKVENDYKIDKRSDEKIFTGSIDWTGFYLTAEEVEENSLKVEQAIEDYNNNKNKKR